MAWRGVDTGQPVVLLLAMVPVGQAREKVPDQRLGIGNALAGHGQGVKRSLGVAAGVQAEQLRRRSKGESE